MSVNVLDAALFLGLLKKAGVDFFAAVPCSYLAPLINEASKMPDFFMSNNEGDAIALCAGASLCGRTPFVMLQNSGLSNAMSPLLSLTAPFFISIIGAVGLRGEADKNDEEHHRLSGAIHHDLLASIGIHSLMLAKHNEEIATQIEIAMKIFSTKRSTFFAVQKDTFKPMAENYRIRFHSLATSIISARTGKDDIPRRETALKILKSIADKEDVFLSTTGLTSRELFSVGDSHANFYMTGSMGCVSSLGLGIALCSKKRVTVLDGDGAFLMRLSAMPMIARYGPSNLFHLLLDNGGHLSTGGQPSGSQDIDFIALLASMRFRKAVYLHSLDELQAAYLCFQKNPTLTFAYLKVSSEIIFYPRPSLLPQENAARFRDFLRFSKL